MSKITSFKVDVYGPLAFDTNKEIPYTLAQLVYEELGQYQKDNQGLRWFAEMKRPKRIGNYSQYIIGVLKETIFEYQEGKRFRFDTDNGYLLDAVVDLVEGFVAGKPLPTLEAEQVDQQVPGQQGPAFNVYRMAHFVASDEFMGFQFRNRYPMNAITRILMGDKSDKQVTSYLEAMFDSYVVEDSQVSARYLTYPIRPAR